MKDIKDGAEPQDQTEKSTAETSWSVLVRRVRTLLKALLVTREVSKRFRLECLIDILKSEEKEGI